MSPQQGSMLLRQIVPRIASAIPVAVSHVGSEDTQELLQDGTAMAAKILINANRNGKKVTPGNVAYTLQHLKSGRRTVGNSCVDVLASATQLSGRSKVYSVNEDVPIYGETDESRQRVHERRRGRSIHSGRPQARLGAVRCHAGS